MNSAEAHTPNAAVSPEVVAAISAALAQKLRLRPDDVRIAAVRRSPLRRQSAPAAATPAAPVKNPFAPAKAPAIPDLGELELSAEELAVLSAALSAELGWNVTDVRIASIRAV